MMRRISILPFFVAVVTLCSTPALAAGVSDLIKKPETWFNGPDAVRITANILSHQSDAGGWPKNTDTVSILYAGDRSRIKPTFDNKATTDELRFLALRVHAARDKDCEKAFMKGLDYILKAQYPTGGWPQFYPPDRDYHRYITFNDNAMIRLMVFLRQVATMERYSFVDANRRKAAQEAFDHGIECILKCQIKVGGKLTAWCAQHDELDYSPRPGRPYELASISGCESLGIVALLMSLDKPSPETIQAIEGAVAWFESAKLSGTRLEKKEDNSVPGGKDIVVVNDTDSPPLWVSFYEIGSNKPIFSDRDGAAKGTLADIGHERRNGYSWLGYWPQKLLEKDYPAWKAGQAAKKIRIVLVGDSTVTDESGWGGGFKKLLANNAECINAARSGSSSRSYNAMGLWKKALDHKPDYILIQFGHNDQPGKGADRETDPNSTYFEQMGRYITEARAAGIKPVLVTPMTRRMFHGDKLQDNKLEPYAEAVRKLAAKEGVPLVDLNTRSTEIVQKLGPKDSEELGPVVNGKHDSTHLSSKGSDVMAMLVIGELIKAVPCLAPYFNSGFHSQK